MDKAELERRKKALLGRGGLANWIDGMIRQKGLGAVCRSVTTIAGQHRKEAIVIELLVDDQETDRIARVIAYIPEAVYEDDGFNVIDSWLPANVKAKGNEDTRTLLRALRATFSIIRTVGTRARTQGISTDKPIFVHYGDEGFPDYRN